MDYIVEHVKTQLNAATCEVVSQPTGGIVNAGKAAVIKVDGEQYFIKHNDTPLVRFLNPVNFASTQRT